MEVLIVPDHPAESEFEDRKSVFLGHLLPVESEEEAKDFVEKMKKRYGDARHNVWAYRLTDGNFRSSDDGEPSGTGGAPVLDAMVKRGISGCVIVVTRYFGGILLGTGGLVHAYSSAASEALNRREKPVSIPMCPIRWRWTIRNTEGCPVCLKRQDVKRSGRNLPRR